MKQLCIIKKLIIMFDKEKWIIKQLTFSIYIINKIFENQ